MFSLRMLCLSHASSTICRIHVLFKIFLKQIKPNLSVQNCLTDRITSSPHFTILFSLAFKKENKIEDKNFEETHPFCVFPTEKDKTYLRHRNRFTFPVISVQAAITAVATK